MKILVDANNIAHIAWHSIPDRLSINEQKTGAIFGFFNQIRTIANKFGSTDLVFCFDARGSIRKQKYSGYKAHRTKDETMDYESFYRQLDELKNVILPTFGFMNVCWQEGCEADDIIAKIVLQHRQEEQNMIIVSTDQDLYQVIGDNVAVYNPITKKILDEKWFKSKYKLQYPKQFAIVKAIAGCSSDNIIGLKGVGEKTAIKYILGGLKPGSKKEQFIKDNLDTIRENMELTRIPLKETLPVLFSANDFGKGAIVSLFDKYGFESFLGKLGDWQLFFNNEQKER